MRYEHVMAAVCGDAWAILEDKLHEITRVLAFRASGQHFSEDEIQARIGSRSSGVSAPGRSVAVLPVRGTIAHRMGSMDESSGGISTERLSGMLSQAMGDESVATVLLDIDSPGGVVTGVSEFAQQVFEARASGTKRIVALVNGMAASAAYWIASQADEIVSIPSGQAGSIGVFTAHQDLSAALEKEGVKITMISAGKHKVDGNPFEPLSEDHKAFMQARVDEAYASFVRDVARGRGVSVADVKGGYGQGRVLTAKDAKAAGLIDRIATANETISRLVGRSRAAVAETAMAAGPEAVASALAQGSISVNDVRRERARLEMF
jgi:signal peptide peptidase SppA